jgi:hypothetical protein
LASLALQWLGLAGLEKITVAVFAAYCLHLFVWIKMPPVIMPTSTGFRPLIVGIVTVDRATHSALEVRAMLVVHAHIIAYVPLLSIKKKGSKMLPFLLDQAAGFCSGGSSVG